MFSHPQQLSQILRQLILLNNSRWDRYLGMTAAMTQLPHGYWDPSCPKGAKVPGTFVPMEANDEEAWD